MKEIIGSGAEAIIYKDNDALIKDRIMKGYRNELLDSKLRKQRTSREKKILDKLENLNFESPRVLENENNKLRIEYIHGKKLSISLERLDYKTICRMIGKSIAFLHGNNIIHGDLTTSNMIYTTKLYLIDFGLSQISTKVEDKAVDLHLLRQALESKHYTIWQECYKIIIDEYSKYSDSKQVLKRLEKVESRGRNKSK